MNNNFFRNTDTITLGRGLNSSMDITGFHERISEDYFTQKRIPYIGAKMDIAFHG